MFYSWQSAALLRLQMRYGIYLGLIETVVAPFGPSAFNYDIGSVRVAYSSTRASIRCAWCRLPSSIS